MRPTLLIALLFAGCIPPQQPSYFPGPGQPPPAGAQPPAAGYAPAPAAGYAPAPAAASASCQDTLTCYGRCNPLTDACVASCDQQTTPGAQQGAHALLACMAQSGCKDQGCVVQACGAQITTCTGQTVASAPAAPAAPSGGGGADEVMKPEYAYGSLVIPPPRRLLTGADFAGAWESGMGSGESYYNSSGTNVGYSAVSTATHWDIDANGAIREKWKGAYTSSGAALARGVSQDNTGTFTVGGNNTITVHWDATKEHNAHDEYFVVVGWFVGAQEITATLQGPYYNPPTPDDLANPSRHAYMNQHFHRKR